jgi:hypothetical protein
MVPALVSHFINGALHAKLKTLFSHIDFHLDAYAIFFLTLKIHFFWILWTDIDSSGLAIVLAEDTRDIGFKNRVPRECACVNIC